MLDVFNCNWLLIWWVFRFFIFPDLGRVPFLPTEHLGSSVLAASPNISTVQILSLQPTK